VRRIALSLAAVLAFAACRAESPPINPYKDKGRAGPPVVEQEVTDAPPATVTKRDGTQIDLATMWEKQKVLVIFYRGGWCPYCAKQLAELQTNQKKVADAGAIIVGISSDPTADANKTRDKLGLNFELYSDPQLQVISQWGVEDVGSNIARTAAFVVEPGGKVTYRRIGKGPSDQPPIEELLAALEKN
jgi:peroxiredoxin